MRARAATDTLKDTLFRRMAGIVGGEGGVWRGFDEFLALGVQFKQLWLLHYITTQFGMRVQTGPFAGLIYDPPTFEGGMLPRLLGSYESGLHPHLLALPARNYDAVINIGSAEGYYAAGLARLLPDTAVYAFEIDGALRAAARQVAADNGLEDRIVFAERFTPDALAAFADRNLLMLCDIEGAEFTLLDAARFPQYRSVDLIVELHAGASSPAVDAFLAPFAETHTVTLVNSQERIIPDIPVLEGMGDINQLIAICEFRSRGTPWAVLVRRR